MFTKLLIFFEILFLIGVTQEAVPNITPCNSNDPELNVCIKNIFNQVIPNLKDGIVEKNIGSIDPILYPRIRLNTTGTFDIIGNLEKVKFKGLSTVKVIAVKSDLSKSRIDLKIQLSRLDVDSLVNAYGQLIFLPFRINGKATININGITALFKLYFKRVNQNNDVFLSLDKSALNYVIKGAKFNVQDFNSPILGEAMTQILNDNSVEFAKAMHPAISGTISDIFETPFRQYFLSVPERIIFTN